ncbi:S-layer homology domain-containing protein [Paenibacillus baimaensis]|nr:S-layer homology domain-containing protein [Paenibacillus sp. WQ 127069]
MKYLKHMKKLINFTLMFALLVSILPLPAAQAASSFFIPDDASLAVTGNMDISSTPAARANLNRTTAKVTNAGTLSITGSFQQMTGSTLTLTVDQIVSINNTAWTAQSGRTFNTSVGATNNRFQISGVQLFPGYNRLTFNGSQGGATKTDVFYVLYDTAPLINTLQITSNNQNYDLNESTGLVLTNSVAYIQGNASNATKVTVNGQSASVLSNGLYYAPAITLTPGLNKFDITLSNNTDSVNVKRQVYYYDPTQPFTAVSITEGAETKDILGTIPTLTDPAGTASLTMELLYPFQAETFDNTNVGITINGQAVSILPDPPAPAPKNTVETVITNTYGDPAYKLVKFKTTVFNLPATINDPSSTQPVIVSLTYPTLAAAPIAIGKAFSFKHVTGTVIRGVELLSPEYTGGAVDDSTSAVPFNGSSVTGSDFYIMVDPSQPLTAAGTPNELKVAIQPLGTVTLGVALTAIVPTGTVNAGKQIYKITGLPEGTQTLAFSAGTAPVSYTGKITFVAKLYVDLDNIYNDQVFNINSSAATVQSITLKGKIIGFGNSMLAKQLIINNTSVPFPNISAVQPDGSYNIDPTDLIIGDSDLATPGVQPGPLFTGRNVLKIIVDYSDNALPTPGVLRKYTKEVTFYVVDENTPNINIVRPLTPPNGPRGDISSTDPTVYLPASPELILSNNTYTTTLAKFDFFIEGAGANLVTVREGQNLMYTGTPTPGSTAGNAYYSSVNYDGTTSGFKIRMNDVPLSAGTHVYTIEFTNTAGAKVNQTLTVISQSVPYRLLAPIANTGEAIIVNKNFITFDVEAVGASDVKINGNSAKPRTDVANRFVYTLTGLKGDTDNKINLVVQNGTNQAKETITVRYVTSNGVGAMFMEPLGTKHDVFNKNLQLTFPKTNVLRRVIDGKIEPTGNILFGIADPKNGNTDLVNDYNQKLGTDIDYRTPQTSQTVIPIDSSLSTQFSNDLGRDHFTRVSDYFWISAGLGEQSKVGASDYKYVTGGLAPYSTEGTYTRYNNYANRKISPTDRGTLTLKYNDAVVDQSATEVTVFYLGDDGIWRNIGGEVNIKAKTIEVPFDNFGYYMVGKLKYGYEDVSNHEWARNILQTLLAKGYMPALRSNDFGASDYVTRGEFAALLVRSLGMRLNYDDKKTFFDIIPGSRSATWNYEEIETAARAGIVQGLNDLVFAPDLQLTRQDAAVMISRALNVKLAVNDDKLKAKIEKAFADSDSINNYARSAVDALNSAGIMVGSNVVSPIPSKNKPLVNFYPLANMTRAEAGQVAVRLLQKYLKALPANL